MGLRRRRKKSRRFVHESSGTLISSSASSCSCNLLLQIENDQFHVRYPGFSMYFQGKKSVTSTIMLCKDDTLDKENVFMIFDELRVRNSPLQILFLWTQLFLKISLSTSSRQQVSCLHYVSQTTVLHMRNINKQTKS